MTSNFDKSGPARKGDAASQSSPRQTAPAAALDNLKRDRFELLSAYLDGEVTVSERRQVEHWLKTDQTVRCLYSRLLKLRQGMRVMSVPVSEQQPVEQTIEAVYQKVDRRPKVVFAWVGAALALLAVPLFTSNLTFQTQNDLNQPPEPIEAEELPDLELPDKIEVPKIEVPKIDLNNSLLGTAASGEVVGQDDAVVDQDTDIILNLNMPLMSIPQVAGSPLNGEDVELASDAEPETTEPEFK